MKGASLLIGGSVAVLAAVHRTLLSAATQGMVKVTDSGGPPVAIPIRSRRIWLERLPSWAKRLVTIGVLPDDPEEERLRKASLVLTASLVTVLAMVWVLTYLMLGLYVSAAIPFGYQVISVASIVVLGRNGRFAFFRASQLILMLVLPVLLQWSLGGFLASSGVMLWRWSPPLGALVFSPRPLHWFWGYLASSR